MGAGSLWSRLVGPAPLGPLGPIGPVVGTAQEESPAETEQSLLNSHQRNDNDEKGNKKQKPILLLSNIFFLALYVTTLSK